MKNKIKKFSKGDFQLAQPQVVFPDTSLILTIGEGEVYKGYFMIKNRGEGSIRGLVYSSSFRMRCLEQGFEGNPVRVEFEYDGRGLLPGHVEQGHIYRCVYRRRIYDSVYSIDRETLCNDELR